MHLFHIELAHKKPTCYRFFVLQYRYLVRLVFTGLLCVAPPVLALEPESSDLSLQEAVAKSLNHHPELAGFNYRMKSTEAYAKQAAVGEKPEINLTIEDAFGSGEFGSLDSAQSTLSISWILEAALLDRRVGAFQAKKTLVEIEREIKSYDIAAETTHDFLTVLAYQERLLVAEQAKKQAQFILKDIEKRVDAGKSPRADQLRAEVSLERRELDVEDIHHELKAAKRKLAAQWGQTSIAFDKVSGSLILPEQVADYVQLQAAISENPNIRYFLTQQRVTDSEITLAKEEAKNRWRINTGVRRYERTDDYGFTVGVSLPIGKSNRNQGRVSALSAEQDRYRADAQAKEIQLATQLYILYEELKHSHHLNDALANKILPRLEQALNETQKAYEVGKYSYLEWSAVQNDVLATRMELIDARLKAHSNMIEIERLTGLSMSKTVLNTGGERQ